jgi:hypothetical protein
VVRRLEARGLLEHVPCPQDNAPPTPGSLRPTGISARQRPRPRNSGRENVIDALTPSRQLGEIADVILHRLDPRDARSAPINALPANQQVAYSEGTQLMLIVCAVNAAMDAIMSVLLLPGPAPLLPILTMQCHPGGHDVGCRRLETIPLTGPCF